MQSLDLMTFTALYIINEMTSKHSKEAINSVLKLKLLAADEGTLSVPFNHRQEVNVVLQHSR